MLTLDAWEPPAWTEEVEVGGNGAAELRPERKETAAISRTPASRLDSFDEDEEGDAAEQMVVLDLLREASVDGGSDGELHYGSAMAERKKEREGGGVVSGRGNGGAWGLF